MITNIIATSYVLLGIVCIIMGNQQAALACALTSAVTLTVCRDHKRS